MFLKRNKKTEPLAVLMLVAFFLCFSPISSSAQLSFKHWQTFQQSQPFFPSLDLDQKLSFKYQPSKSSNRFLNNSDANSDAAFSSFMARQTPGYLDIHELGWFCTLDLRLDMNMTMPFRFRLGNLESVNRKEGYYDYERE